MGKSGRLGVLGELSQGDVSIGQLTGQMVVALVGLSAGCSAGETLDCGMSGCVRVLDEI